MSRRFRISFYSYDNIWIKELINKTKWRFPLGGGGGERRGGRKKRKEKKALGRRDVLISFLQDVAHIRGYPHVPSREKHIH